MGEAFLVRGDQYNTFPVYIHFSVGDEFNSSNLIYLPVDKPFSTITLLGSVFQVQRGTYKYLLAISGGQLSYVFSGLHSITIGTINSGAGVGNSTLKLGGLSSGTSSYITMWVDHLGDSSNKVEGGKFISSFSMMVS